MSDKEKLVELLQSSPVDHEGNRGVGTLADHLIANGVTIQRWIPVTERLPEENGRYLCNVKSFAFPGCFYQAILQCDKHGFREGNIYTEDVTHWMPLPQQPKGE